MMEDAVPYADVLGIMEARFFRLIAGRDERNRWVRCKLNV
jgi:hypothetical protein